MKRKAVGLLSGGLDSILACRMILDQGIDVVAINFVSPFCTCTRKGCRHQASKVAEELGIPIKVMPTDHRNPPTKLNRKKREYSMLAAPATIGAKVRTKGMKRARMIVLPPCFS